MGALASCKKDGPISNEKSIIGTWVSESVAVYSGADQVKIDDAAAKEIAASMATIEFQSGGKGVITEKADGETHSSDFAYTVDNGTLTVTFDRSISVVSVKTSVAYKAEVNGDKLTLTQEGTNDIIKLITRELGKEIDKVVYTFKRK